MKKPKTLGEVRDSLCEMYEQVMSDARRAPQVHEGANALGKAIGACKMHLEYCALKKIAPSGDWESFIKN